MFENLHITDYMQQPSIDLSPEKKDHDIADNDHSWRLLTVELYLCFTVYDGLAIGVSGVYGEEGCHSRIASLLEKDDY